jgi:hypothetical protein
LALGAVPSPWTVAIFSPNGQVDATTYDVSGANAYRLLGFGPDGAHLIGYETSGEAGFTDKPVSLDLAHGAVVLTPLDGFPAGLQSNGTTSPLLGRINPVTGDALTIANDAKGPADWVLRSHGADRSFGFGPPGDLTWADGSTVAIVACCESPSVPIATSATANPGPYLGLSITSSPGVRGRLLVAYPGVVDASGSTASPVGLISARDGFILVYTGGPPCCVGANRSGPSDVLLVDVHNQHSAGPDRPGDVPARLGLWFAGWIGGAP